MFKADMIAQCVLVFSSKNGSVFVNGAGSLLKYPAGCLVMNSFCYSSCS